MYLQITEKCNMNCDHCCFSCTMKGKHGDKQTIMNAIEYIADQDDYAITIGGGEPTLHPDFFDILERCLDRFDCVWMATNGSQSEVMHRLVDIMDGEDFPECDCLDYMTEEDLDHDGCTCHERSDYDSIYGAEDKLSVAVSNDCFHDEIEPWVKNTWKNRGWELRDVTRSHDGVSDKGRANENQLSYNDHCACPGIFINPQGKIKPCGCPDSPVIGDIYNGIDEEWENLLQDEEYRDNECYNKIKTTEPTEQ